ncbi:phosphate/phosphite/phosphonate ABC transporter substrate-binding protein [Pseudomonas oryzihabitans]|uniref:phosphate/phosphite/phosphonate ABC transporter substrate-binding protein n=1 Tax=Pseudomonas oryzihabitans TaxID=47885 RepID=UPI002861001C|nr:PhnD/SsuA/transferrin family substrate-binding protein [Pseudomonas psychrotolerans]MDR6677782.1 ABC-type phosphate/phosphonate transport system substrate-binding protein [Pseudomonas psychrotolerans]
MTVAALTMYVEPAEVRAAYRQLADAVARRLDVELAPAPDELPTLWSHPDLLLAQTCGYPWATRLRGQVHLVAAPRYDFEGCAGAEHCAFILVPETLEAESLADLRGKRVALNGLDSNTGMNLLRHAVAPLAERGRFFGEVIVSESHANSLALLQQGHADVAAVDAVTYGYLRRAQPERVDGLRLLQRTRPSPTLPFITTASRSDAEVDALRAALNDSLAADPALASLLAMDGVAAVDETLYLSVLDWRREAVEQGYPVIA